MFFLGKDKDGLPKYGDLYDVMKRYVCRGINKPCPEEIDKDKCYVPYIKNDEVIWQEVDCP